MTELETLRTNDKEVDDLWKRCEKLGIEADCNVRWEQGINHHPEAEAIFKLIMQGDWAFMGDYFCWKKGGDGDNGETLMYSLSVMLELRDAERKPITPPKGPPNSAFKCYGIFGSRETKESIRAREDYEIYIKAYREGLKAGGNK